MRRGTVGEAGFTLVELLLTITILGIVMVPIAASFMVGLRATSEAEQRITDSRAAQITSTFFAGDVQSASTVAVADPAPCGGATGASVVSFRWADDASSANVASYVVQSDAISRRLVRLRCVGSTVTATTPLARDLGTGTPSVSCSPSCASPRSVKMVVTERSGFTFTPQGTRRTS